MRDDDLPSGCSRPMPKRQNTLFPEERNTVLARMKVGMEELLRWQNQGWLSFDPGATQTLVVKLQRAWQGLARRQHRLLCREL